MFNTLKKISRAPHLTNRATASVTDYNLCMHYQLAKTSFQNMLEKNEILFLDSKALFLCFFFLGTT